MGPAVVVSACDGPQSALDPAGYEAERVADLSWIMFGGAVAIWALVIGLAVYATRISPRPHPGRWLHGLIIGGGIAFPAIVLGGFLIEGLLLMRDLRKPEASMQIRVSGEQWWWRVTYLSLDGRGPVESANEIRMPVGERVELILESPDVIHSLWIPSLAGKMDMVPGRVNRLVVEPTTPGVFRGACAEFCGTSHALMAFSVVVMERREFASWLEREAEPAVALNATAERGLQLFLATGCGGCHTIRGTDAKGVIGPDLTHVGSRRSLGAGVLPNDAEAMREWITRTQAIKPGVHMPSFNILQGEELEAVAAYLTGLK